MHDDFINVVRNCWNEKGQDNHEPFYDVYNRFRNRVGIWKKIYFGDINRKIELIEHKLENAFFDIGRNYSDEKHHALKQLEKEHQNLLTPKRNLLETKVSS